jgi:hypothetical protein
VIAAQTISPQMSQAELADGGIAQPIGPKVDSEVFRSPHRRVILCLTKVLGKRFLLIPKKFPSEAHLDRNCGWLRHAGSLTL